MRNSYFEYELAKLFSLQVVQKNVQSSQKYRTYYHFIPVHFIPLLKDCSSHFNMLVIC